MFRGIVVLVALASTIGEGSADVRLVVVVPTLEVSGTWSALHRLFTGSYIGRMPIIVALE